MLEAASMSSKGRDRWSRDWSRNCVLCLARGRKCAPAAPNFCAGKQLVAFVTADHPRRCLSAVPLYLAI
jgi:hypothetical protein